MKKLSKVRVEDVIATDVVKRAIHKGWYYDNANELVESITEDALLELGHSYNDYDRDEEEDYADMRMEIAGRVEDELNGVAPLLKKIKELEAVILKDKVDSSKRNSFESDAVMSFEGEMSVSGSIGGHDFEGKFYLDTDGGSGWEEFYVDTLDYDNDDDLELLSEFQQTLYDKIVLTELKKS